MTKLKFIICILFLANYSFSQEEKKPLKTGWNISHKNILTNNQSALFVVNGIILDKVVMEKIPTNNIESLEVLKDEKATSSYGELGKNGVILIQTKEISEVDLKNLYKLYPITFDLNLKQKVKIISGEITDCENVPLSNVLVQNLNTKKSTFTDSLGKYTIDVRKNDILSYSNQNYQSQRIQFIKQKKIIVSLKMIPRNDKIILKKPVIYLYPKEKADIELSINFDGKILTTFPKLEKSWKVTAFENGQIFDKKTNRFYNSLFWDGEISFPASHYQYKTGFVVEKENLTSFLIEKLEFMGLNTTETNDFVQYWLPILEQNKFTFIHFLVNEEYDIFSTNNVNPKPETSIRIMMEFFGVEEPISIAPQQLPSTKRSGFTLVEWGGSDVSNVIDVNELLKNQSIQKHITFDKKINFEKPNPLYIIDKKMVSKKTFNKLTCDDIIQIEVLNSDKAPVLFGEKGVFGAIIVTTNKIP